MSWRGARQGVSQLDHHRATACRTRLALLIVALVASACGDAEPPAPSRHTPSGSALAAPNGIYQVDGVDEMLRALEDPGDAVLLTRARKVEGEWIREHPQPTLPGGPTPELTPSPAEVRDRMKARVDAQRFVFEPDGSFRFRRDTQDPTGDTPGTWTLDRDRISVTLRYPDSTARLDLVSAPSGMYLVLRNYAIRLRKL